MTKFEQLLCRHIGSSFAKQSLLDEYLGEHQWQLNLDSGHIDFGGGRSFPVQIVGTEAEADGTWLWAWGNRASRFNPALVNCATRMRAFGAKETIPEFTQPLLRLNQIDPNQIAIVACGLCKADAYYRAPFPGGAVHLHFSQTPLTLDRFAPSAIVAALQRVVATYPVNHVLVVRSFLTQQGYVLSGDATKITGTRPNEEPLEISFDSAARIDMVKGALAPSERTTATGRMDY